MPTHNTNNTYIVVYWGKNRTTGNNLRQPPPQPQTLLQPQGTINSGIWHGIGYDIAQYLAAGGDEQRHEGAQDHPPVLLAERKNVPERRRVSAGFLSPVPLSPLTFSPLPSQGGFEVSPLPTAVQEPVTPARRREAFGGRGGRKRENDTTPW